MASSIAVHSTSTPPHVALQRFLQGPALLENAIGELGAEVLDRPAADGGWSIREIVHHIADGDDIWRTAIRIAVGSDRAEFALDWYRSQSQRDWAHSWAYARRSVAESLTLLLAGRNHVAALLSAVPDSWSRSVSLRDATGSVELITVGFIVEMQTEHLLHHVDRIMQLRTLALVRGLPE